MKQQTYYVCAVAAQFAKAVPVFCAFTLSDAIWFQDNNECAMVEAHGQHMHKSVGVYVFSQPRSTQWCMN